MNLAKMPDEVKAHAYRAHIDSELTRLGVEADKMSLYTSMRQWDRLLESLQFSKGIVMSIIQSQQSLDNLER